MMSSSAPVLRAAQLTVHRAAIAHNYRRLVAACGSVPVAAAVKANAYGVGLDAAVPTLVGAGCRTFFVATVDEGVDVRAMAPQATIFVLSGAMPGTVEDLMAQRLTPVLNDLGQVERWGSSATDSSRRAAVHVDTGMQRLGLAGAELTTLVEQPERIAGIDVVLVMSHLHSADDPASPDTERQLTAFRAARARLPVGDASLANSAGITRGAAYHFDLTRPGIGLYGGQPALDSDLDLHQCAEVRAPIISVRAVAAGTTVGYSATYTAPDDRLIATVSAGYGDGFLRSGSGKAEVSVDSTPCPVVGRISMDLLTVDVTDVDPTALYPGAPVELLGPNQPVDAVARRADTISFEVLTSLGGRYARTVV